MTYTITGKKQSETDFNHKDIVFLVTDPEQLDRIVTLISFSADGQVVYTLKCGIEESSHQSFEISSTKKVF